MGPSLCRAAKGGFLIWIKTCLPRRPVTSRAVIPKISRPAVRPKSRPAHGELPRQQVQAKAEARVEPPVKDAAAALEGVSPPPSVSPRSERLAALWRYSREHGPGEVTLPGVPRPPRLEGQRLIVVNKGPNQGQPGESSIMLFDLGTGRLRKKLATLAGPHEVMVSPSGRLAVAPNYGLQVQGTGVETGGGDSLTVVDLVREQATTLKLDGWFRPHGVEWLDDTRVAVTVDGKGRDLSSGYVLLVDVTSGEVERAIRTGEGGTHLVRRSPDGDYLFASNIQGGSFSRIDLKTFEVKTISTGKGTEGFDFSPDGKEIWTGNLEENTISIIDVATFTEKQKLASPGDKPIRFKFVGPNLLLVANRGSNDLSFIDPRTQQPIGRQLKFELSRFGEQGPEEEKSSVPMQLELSPDRRYAFVGNSHAGLVSVVDLKARELAGYYLAGSKPDPLALYSAPRV